MIVLDRNASVVTYLLEPGDGGIEGYQIAEYRGPRGRLSLATLNRSRLLEDWRDGRLRWQGDQRQGPQ